jgi:hypothetical protein
MPPKTKKNRPRVSECEAAGMSNVKRADMVRMVRALGAEEDLAKIVRARASQDFNRQPTRAELCAAINARRQTMSRRKFLLLLGPALVALALGTAVWRREILGILPIPKNVAVKQQTTKASAKTKEDSLMPSSISRTAAELFEPTTRAGVRILARPPQNRVVYATVAAAERERRAVLRQQALVEQRMARIERDSRAAEFKNAQRQQKWVAKMAVAEAQVARAETPVARRAALEAKRAVMAQATEAKNQQRAASRELAQAYKVASADVAAHQRKADTLKNVINKHYDAPPMLSPTYDIVPEEYDEPPGTQRMSPQTVFIHDTVPAKIVERPPTHYQPMPSPQPKRPSPSDLPLPPQQQQQYAAPPTLTGSSTSRVPGYGAGIGAGGGSAPVQQQYVNQRPAGGIEASPPLTGGYVSSRGTGSSKLYDAPPSTDYGSVAGGGSSTSRAPQRKSASGSTQSFNYQIPAQQQSSTSKVLGYGAGIGAGGGSAASPIYGQAPQRRYASGDISSSAPVSRGSAQGLSSGRTYKASPAAAELIVGPGMGAAGYVALPSQSPYRKLPATSLSYGSLPAEKPLKARQQYRKMPAGGVHPSEYREFVSAGAGGFASDVAAEAQKRKARVAVVNG